jgi:hypothetical protein
MSTGGAGKTANFPPHRHGIETCIEGIGDGAAQCANLPEPSLLRLSFRVVHGKRSTPDLVMYKPIYKHP